MFSVAYLCICLYCMLQLILFLIMENRRRKVRSRHEAMFMSMLIISLFAFVANIMSSIHQGPDWFFLYSAAGNYIEFILSTALVPIFYCYICEQIPNLDPALRGKLNRILWAMAALCAALILSTALTGQIFYFDSAQMYHRGPLFYLPMCVLLSMMLIVECFLASQKQNIQAHDYRSLIFFLVFPLIGWTLHFFIYGLPFSLMGITFAALILFINRQNRDIDKDYLTGAFSRQTLDNYMRTQIAMSTRQKTFTAILLDIDDFKSINDRFGHFEGDIALTNAVDILRRSVGRNDFIARYGGDEFCVVLDSDDSRIVEETIRRIDWNLAFFNRNGDKPYRLSFSMGYATYRFSLGKGAESFYQFIDQKMYEKKNSRKVHAFNDQT